VKRLIPLALAITASVLLLAGCMTTMELEALTLVNQSRNDNGLGTLSANETLTTKAKGWALHLLDNSNNQCTSNTLVHSNLTSGTVPGSSNQRENVGCAIVNGGPESAPASLHQAFMASSGHRTTILHPSVNIVGIGMVDRYLGNNSWLVYEAQEFAWI